MPGSSGYSPVCRLHWVISIAYCALKATFSDNSLSKTRSPIPNSACFGVDLNRNFPVNFGGLGSSDLPCIDLYHGPASFSEAESQAIRNVVTTSRPNVKAAISIHTYPQLVRHARILSLCNSNLEPLVGILVNVSVCLSSEYAEMVCVR